MIRINLLPVKAAQKKEKLRGQLIILAVSVILASAACVAVYGAVLSKIDVEKESIAQKEGEINRLRKTIGEVAHFKKLQQELQAKLDTLEKIKTARSGPVRLLDELSKSLPDKLWLVSFKESGGNITLSGIGLKEEIVAEFLRNLESSPYYQNVELKVIEQKSEETVSNCRSSMLPVRQTNQPINSRVTYESSH